MSNFGDVLLSFAEQEAAAHPDFFGRVIGHGIAKILQKHNVDPAVVASAQSDIAGLVTDALPVVIQAVTKK